MTAPTPRRWCIGVTLLALAAPAAGGEFDFEPYVATQYMYDSNVYRFSNQVADVTGTTETVDRNLRFTAGIDTRYLWQRQILQAMAERRTFHFDTFTHLDHNEYTLAAAYDGRILTHTQVLLDARDERRMATFEDRRSTQLIMERDQVGSATVKVAVTPEWQVQTGVRGRHLRSPLPDAPALPRPPPGAPARVASPNFAMNEAAVNAGVRYGIENKEHPEEEAPLLVGALLEYSTVDFSGVTPQPPPPPGVTPETFDGYSLTSLVATGAYAIDGLSTLDGKAGISLYNPSGGGSSNPNLTGEIGATRKYSVVTEFNAQLFLRTVPYISAADVTVDAGVSVGVKWNPLRMFDLVADYSVAKSEFSGLSRIAPENSGRSDIVQSATLSVGYPPPGPRLFFLRMFASYNDRNSNRHYNDYNGITVGAELSFRWGKAKPETE